MKHSVTSRRQFIIDACAMTTVPGVMPRRQDNAQPAGNGAACAQPLPDPLNMSKETLT